MAGFGGFFTGEKKKQKKGNQKNRPIGTTPVFVVPTLIAKDRKEK